MNRRGLLDKWLLLWRVRFFRFLVVGALNTAFGYGVFALLILSGLHYTLAALASTVLGVLFNFKTTGLIVFSSRRNSLLLRFVGVYAISYFVSIFLLGLFKRFGVNVLLTAAALALPLALLSYSLNRTLVFRRPGRRDAAGDPGFSER